MADGVADARDRADARDCLPPTIVYGFTKRREADVFWYDAEEGVKFGLSFEVLKGGPGGIVD